MEKEFVPYELAVKLKALGFDEPSLARWIEKDSREGGGIKLEIWNDEDTYYEVKSLTKAPTFSQAFRWFREKYNLKSFIQPIPDDVDTYIFAYGTKEIEHNDEDYLKYEEAELACLTKLIEIIEGQKD